MKLVLSVSAIGEGAEGRAAPKPSWKRLRSSRRSFNSPLAHP